MRSPGSPNSSGTAITPSDGVGSFRDGVLDPDAIPAPTDEASRKEQVLDRLRAVVADLEAPPRRPYTPTMQCVICKRHPATMPPDIESRIYCAACFRVRMRQLHAEENKFHLMRDIRTPSSEKLFLYHDDVTSDNGCCGVVHTTLASHVRHLDISCYLFENLAWDDSVSVLYDEGVESSVRYVDLLTGFIEVEVVAGWPCRTWSAELNKVVGDPLYLDSNDPPIENGDRAKPET